MGFALKKCIFGGEMVKEKNLTKLTKYNNLYPKLPKSWCTHPTSVMRIFLLKTCVFFAVFFLFQPTLGWFRPNLEESIANTRNVGTNFLNFEKMKMASALLTEFAEEHKKYLDCNSRFYTKGLPTPSMCAVIPTYVLGPDSQSLPLKLAIFTPST